jgi:uncharacterized protein (DUF433 family)
MWTTGSDAKLVSDQRGFANMSRITLEPGKRGGRPCIRGLRITVYDVLSMLSSGMTHQEVLADFPELEPEDVLAVLAYAADREHSVYSLAVE